MRVGIHRRLSKTCSRHGVRVIVFVAEGREFVFVGLLEREFVSGDNHPDLVKDFVGVRYTGANAVHSLKGFDLDWSSDCVHDSYLCAESGRGYAMRNRDANGLVSAVIGVQDFGDGI